MGAREFGQMVEQAMKQRRMSQARLAVLVGELPGEKVLNETQIRRIREGGRRLEPVLVGRLIEVLGLDPLPAWQAAGLWPPGITADDLSELRAARVEAARRAASEGAAALPLSLSDQGKASELYPPVYAGSAGRDRAA